MNEDEEEFSNAFLFSANSSSNEEEDCVTALIVDEPQAVQDAKKRRLEVASEPQQQQEQQQQQQPLQQKQDEEIDNVSVTTKAQVDDDVRVGVVDNVGDNGQAPTSSLSQVILSLVCSAYILSIVTVFSY